MQHNVNYYNTRHNVPKFQSNINITRSSAG